MFCTAFASSSASSDPMNSPVPSATPAPATTSPTSCFPSPTPPSTVADRPMGKRGEPPKNTVDFLKAWLYRHSDHPYPSEEEKKELCSATGLSMGQVSRWMTRARRRMLAPAHRAAQRPTTSSPYIRTVPASYLLDPVARRASPPADSLQLYHPISLQLPQGGHGHRNSASPEFSGNGRQLLTRHVHYNGGGAGGGGGSSGLDDFQNRLGLSVYLPNRQHSYIISGRRPSTQTLLRVSENSSFGTDTGVGGPFTADQRRFLEPSPLTTPNVVPSIQPITSTIQDLTELITRYSLHPISGGTYGDIHKCIYHGPEGDADVAVKAIRPQYFNNEIFRRELGIWKRLRHSNILKFMGTASGFGASVALVAPWMTNGTLTSFLSQNKTLGLHDRLLLLRDIVAGLNYLHTVGSTEDGHTDLNPVVHGDLTGTNVLIDGDRKAYLADFGLSGTIKKEAGMTYLAKMSRRAGALRWAAPELLFGEESDFAPTTRSDMYSFGSIMLQVLTGNIPWHSICDFQIPHKVVDGGEVPPRPDNNDYITVTDQHWSFMTHCWSKEPVDRPPAKEAVQFVDSALRTSTSPPTST